MTRSIAYRLIALLVLAALGVAYIVYSALGIRLWDGPYTVRVMLPSGGGIYSDAAVTYRGVQIGKVAKLHLHPGFVEVDLSIDHGTRIPADVDASVKELTAAAEQYIELTPQTPAGPVTEAAAYLHSGATIGLDRSSVPTSVGTLLNTVNSLVNSVHASNLNQISVALAQGLDQAGPDLRAIIDDGNTLVTALNQVSGPTVTAIDNGVDILQTLRATTPNFVKLANGLDGLTRSIADTNTAAFLQNGGQATASLDQLLTDDNAANIGLTNGLSETAGLANARQGAVQAFFQILPIVANNAALTVNQATGTARFQVTVNSRNTVCPYTSTMAEPTSLVATADLDRSCGSSAPDLLQRGAAKAPTPAGGTP